MKKLIVFDLDGTLAESKSPLDAETGGLLARLLSVVRAALISGASWAQFEKQVLSQLPTDANLQHLSILPTCGAQFYSYGQGWTARYREDFSAVEKTRIVEALRGALAQWGFEAKHQWGDLIEDRGSQITFSALGQEAPLDAKKQWDPDFSKRQSIKAILDGLMPELSVQLGAPPPSTLQGQASTKDMAFSSFRRRWASRSKTCFSWAMRFFPAATIGQQSKPAWPV